MKSTVLVVGLPFVLGAASAPILNATTGGANYTPNAQACVRLVSTQELLVRPQIAAPQLAKPQKPQGAPRALPPCGKLDSAVLGAYPLPFPPKIRPVPAATGK